jgi:hypothetical protein
MYKNFRNVNINGWNVDAKNLVGWRLKKKMSNVSFAENK